MPGELRKFCAKQSDVLQWHQSNKNYLLTHGASEVDADFTSIRCLSRSITFIYYWADESLKI